MNQLIYMLWLRPIVCDKRRTAYTPQRSAQGVYCWAPKQSGLVDPINVDFGFWKHVFNIVSNHIHVLYPCVARIDSSPDVWLFGKPKKEKMT